MKSATRFSWPLSPFECLLLFALGLAATVPHWHHFLDMDDEACCILGAVRLLEGDLPYRDFLGRNFPGSYFLMAPWLAIFGTSILSQRVAMGVISSLTGLVLAWLGRRLSPGVLGLLPWLLWTCLGLQDKPNYNYHWWGVLGTCLTLACLEQLQRHPSRAAAVTTGLAAAASGWMLQSNGASSLAAVLVVLIRERPGHARWILGTYLAAQAAFWAPWVVLGYGREVWLAHFEPLQRHSQFNRQPYSWREYFELFQALRQGAWNEQPLFRQAAWLQLGLGWLQYATFFPIILLNVWLSERRGGHRALSYGCLAWALTPGYNLAPNYLSYCYPALYLSLLSLISFRPQLRFFGLVCSVPAVLLAIWLTRSSFQAYVYPVNTRAGILWSFSLPEAKQFNALNRWIQENCPPGTPVLAVPHFASIYTLHHLRCAIPDPNLIPWLFSEREFMRAIDVVERDKVPFIFQRVVDPSHIEQSYPAVPAEEYRQLEARYLQQMTRNYSLVLDLGNLRVWGRR